jgi:hypothetical protein
VSSTGKTPRWSKWARRFANDGTTRPHLAADPGLLRGARHLVGGCAPGRHPTLHTGCRFWDVNKDGAITEDEDVERVMRVTNKNK